MSVQNALTRAAYVLGAAAALLFAGLFVGTLLVVFGAITPPPMGLLDKISWYGDASRIALLGMLTAMALAGIAAVTGWAGYRASQTAAARTAAAE